MLVAAGLIPLAPLAVWGTHANRLSHRALWWLYAAGIAVIALATVPGIDGVHVGLLDTPLPALVRIVGMAVLVGAIARLVQVRHAHTSPELLLDALLTGTATGLVCWALWVVPVFDGFPPTRALLTALYPSLAAFGVVVAYRLGFGSRTWTGAGALVLAGFLGVLVAAVVTTLALGTRGGTRTGLSIATLLSLTALAAAVTHPSARLLEGRQPEREGVSYVRLGQLATVLLVPAALFGFASATGGSAAPGIVGSVAIVALVTVRIGITARVQARTTARLAALAGHDDLTGLENRARLRHRIMTALE